LCRGKKTGKLDILIISMQRFSEKLGVIGAHDRNEISTSTSRKIGRALIVERLWSELGIDRVLNAVAARKSAGTGSRRTTARTSSRWWSAARDTWPAPRQSRQRLRCSRLAEWHCRRFSASADGFAAGGLSEGKVWHYAFFGFCKPWIGLHLQNRAVEDGFDVRPPPKGQDCTFNGYQHIR